MAISTWKASLDDIAESIRVETQAYKNSSARITAAYNNLNAIPTDYADAVTEIQALGDDPAELVAKDELVKLTAEFIALRTAINSAVTALEDIEV